MSKTILIAEDESIVSLDLKFLLKRNNYLISSVVSTCEGILFQIQENKPDLIILDYNLGAKIEGKDAVIEIKKHDDIPIILISDSIQSMVQKFVEIVSNVAVLPKPFKQSDLLYLVNKFCKQYSEF